VEFIIQLVKNDCRVLYNKENKYYIHLKSRDFLKSSQYTSGEFDENQEIFKKVLSIHQENLIKIKNFSKV